MKLEELFLDFIGNTSLYEMATERKEVKRLWNGLSRQIWFHFIKLHIFEDAENENYWKNEIYVMLSELVDIKVKRTMRKPARRLRKEVMYDWFFIEGYELDIDMFNRKTKEMFRGKYKNLKRKQYDSNEVVQNIQTIMKTIFIDMEMGKLQDIDVYLLG